MGIPSDKLEGVHDAAVFDIDGDGLDDPIDPYPRDPFPEYILYRNDLGTIDIMLSNRDGTFQTEQQIGVAVCKRGAGHQQRALPLDRGPHRKIPANIGDSTANKLLVRFGHLPGHHRPAVSQNPSGGRQKGIEPDR